MLIIISRAITKKIKIHGKSNKGIEVVPYKISIQHKSSNGEIEAKKKEKRFDVQNSKMKRVSPSL